MADIQVLVVTPEATAVNQSTDFIAVPLDDGELGIAYNHAPLIGRLGCGELRFESDGNSHRYYVEGGFVQVADNVVSVMTSRAIASDDLQQEEARKALETARKSAANTPELMEARDKHVAQARAAPPSRPQGVAFFCGGSRLNSASRGFGSRPSPSR